MSGANDIQLRDLRDTILQLNNTINTQTSLIMSLQKSIDERNARIDEKDQVIAQIFRHSLIILRISCLVLPVRFVKTISLVSSVSLMQLMKMISLPFQLSPRLSRLKLTLVNVSQRLPMMKSLRTSRPHRFLLMNFQRKNVNALNAVV